MTPKEKANELIDKMYYIGRYDDREDYIPVMAWERAKQCALIGVDVILVDCGAKDWSGDEACDGKKYWEEVKKELERFKLEDCGC